MNVPPESRRKAPRKSADKIVKPGAKGLAKPRVRLDALSEIRKMQKGTNLLLPQSRVMFLATPGCLEAIHTALEAELLYIFKTVQNAACHARRITLMEKDMKFAERILAGRKGIYLRC
ncbi:uncharacterized protein E0L32_004871 [Thyridium curvatum]|uniref:Histone H3.2 n=1 Tax=Thyridium curvatum TaxID=1093900 RepID=A0A507BDN5_9PEZI|nr:uncharacterized protein E0L32_004871 [Thyridium curvatum]TPX15041.1 hypothetical protein E0L32_004871 [Thyridium curvatum]